MGSQGWGNKVWGRGQGVKVGERSRLEVKVGGQGLGSRSVIKVGGRGQGVKVGK